MDVKRSFYSRLLLFTALVCAVACAQAQRGPWHFYGFLNASGPSLNGNVVTVHASGELWTDYPSNVPCYWHVELKVDGVTVWTNGDPSIPNSWPGLTFGYSPLNYTLSSGWHTVEWMGGPTPILMNTQGWIPGFYFTQTFFVP